MNAIIVVSVIETVRALSAWYFNMYKCFIHMHLLISRTRAFIGVGLYMIIQTFKCTAEKILIKLNAFLSEAI